MDVKPATVGSGSMNNGRRCTRTRLGMRLGGSKLDLIVVGSVPRWIAPPPIWEAERGVRER
jgi:hypothetical protein